MEHMCYFNFSRTAARLLAVNIRYFVDEIRPTTKTGADGKPIIEYGVFDSHMDPPALILGPHAVDDANKLCHQLNETWRDDSGGKPKHPRP